MNGCCARLCRPRVQSGPAKNHVKRVAEGQRLLRPSEVSEGNVLLQSRAHADATRLWAETTLKADRSHCRRNAFQRFLRVDANSCSLQGPRRRLRRLDPPRPRRIKGCQRRFGREGERVSFFARTASDAPQVAGPPACRPPPSGQNRENPLAQKCEVLGVAEESVRTKRIHNMIGLFGRSPRIVLQKPPVVADRARAPADAARTGGVGY